MKLKKLLKVNNMTIKKHAGRGRRDISWQKQRADAFTDYHDKEIDIRNNKKQMVRDRIKLAGIKLKNIYKVKLGDDLRAFEYEVLKIDRLEGDVWLKSKRSKIRKVRVFNELFGPVIRGRKRK